MQVFGNAETFEDSTWLVAVDESGNGFRTDRQGTDAPWDEPREIGQVDDHGGDHDSFAEAHGAPYQLDVEFPPKAGE